MTIVTKNEYGTEDFYILYDNSWSGALQTLDDIKNADLEREFMEHLEDVFGDEEVDATALNDYIWFERDSIYDSLGLDENGERVEDDEDAEDQEHGKQMKITESKGKQCDLLQVVKCESVRLGDVLEIA